MSYSADSFVADEQPTTAKWNKLWNNDASFNDGTGIGSGVITPEKLVTGAGTTWPWVSWSPTLTNITLGNGTVTASYKQTGKTVDFKFCFSFGSSGSAMGTTPKFSPPVTAAALVSGADNMLNASVEVKDASTGDAFTGCAFFDSTTAIRVTSLNLNAINVNNSATVPMTWANGDILACRGTYEAA